MKKNYRQIIRLICVGILLAAVFVILVRNGAIPRFWERAAQPVVSTDVSETPDAAEMSGTVNVTEGGVETPEQTKESAASDGEKAPSQQPESSDELSAASEQEAETSEEPPEQTPAEQLEAYLADDPRTPTEAKGIFITGAVAGTANTMPALTELVEETSLNAMVIDIKNDAGEVTYQMGLPLAEEIGAQVRYVADMPNLIRQLKEKDIYLIARIVAFKDPILAEQKPDLAVKNADGSVFHDNNGLAWVNPYKEEVWDYLIELSKQAVELGFDEIQYDYIRFSTAKGISEADFGVEAEGKTKQEAINGFLTKAYETLAPMGVYVSADVFGTIICNESDGVLIGQDYVEMAKHCDYICPMVYPSHYVNDAYGIAVPDAKPYELIYASVADGEKKLAAAREADASLHIAKQRPWLQAFTATWVKGHIPYRGQQLEDQIRGAADAGVPEWLLWNAANNYDKVKSGL